MLRFPDTYSQVMAWLKVILPLIALCLLSTLFLFSRARTPATSIPFIDLELQARIREQQITAPYFVGTTENGLSITLRAESARPEAGNLSRLLSDNIMAEVKTKNEAMIIMFAQHGIFDAGADNAQLKGGVSVTSSTGYSLETDTLQSSLDRVHIESATDVRGGGPIGSFSAGKMILTSDKEDKTLHLLFTNGVTLTYDPNQ
ncbi:MAG: hypothetical protein P8M25_04280 [Paracoccaceae bacterium]|nr:hypothetical protein [Paracoccaceae bacterium]